MIRELIGWETDWGASGWWGKGRKRRKHSVHVYERVVKHNSIMKRMHVGWTREKRTWKREKNVKQLKQQPRQQPRRQ